VHILFIGDIFGRPGRNIVRERLPELVREHNIDLTIANVENAAAGFGVTPALAQEFFDLGIEVQTTGNHIWDKREIMDYFNSADGNPDSPAHRLIRPANYPPGMPGWGFYAGRIRNLGNLPYAVMNLQGRIFMTSNDDPFRTADEILEDFGEDHRSGYSCGSDLGKNRYGMVSRRPGDRSAGYAYPRPDCRRARFAQRHGLHYRRGNERAVRQRDRREEGNSGWEISDQHAGAVRTRHWRGAAVRCGHRLRREHREGALHSAHHA
jgi:hypothetical protein